MRAQRAGNLVVSVSVRATHTSSTKPSEDSTTTSRRRGLSALWNSSLSTQMARKSAWHRNVPLATCLLRLRSRLFLCLKHVGTVSPSHKHFIASHCSKPAASFLCHALTASAEELRPVPGA